MLLPFNSSMLLLLSPPAIKITPSTILLISNFIYSTSLSISLSVLQNITLYPNKLAPSSIALEIDEKNGFVISGSIIAIVPVFLVLSPLANEFGI